jgi:membrane protease YdiL (CAAX protease family)
MGFVQSRLMDRRGLLIGSALTAIPFAVLHLPLAFEAGWTWSSATVEMVAIVGRAPFLRYLLGALYLDTAGSLLAVGLMHASYHAAGKLGAVDGGWQYPPALAVLTVAVAVVRRRRPAPPLPAMPWRARARHGVTTRTRRQRPVPFRSSASIV